MTGILNVKKNNAFGSVSTKGKCEVIRDFQNKEYKVMMMETD